ncbi:MAG: PD-(D/E)XK nuclease family protein, partial [Oscillospiraceae bacterium]|nr:PD-(D/E)XK nuclease family protein [Oscillospiraceae bacterium]
IGLDEGSLKIKASELSLILSCYNALLEKKYRDGRDNLSRLSALLEDLPAFKNRIIAVDGFNGFTGQEYAVLEKIMKQARALYVTVTAGSLQDESGGTGPFTASVRCMNRLREIAEKNGIHIAKPQYLSGRPKFNNFPLKLERYKSREIEALEKSLYDGNPAPYSLDAGDITVFSAPDRFAECEYIALTAKKLIREKGWRCRDIAIIERTEGMYRRKMASALKKCGLSVFEDGRKGILNEPLTVFLLSALDIAAKGFSTDNFMRYLKTGLANVSAEAISGLENYAYLWQVDGAAWKEGFKAHPDGFGEIMTEEAEKRLAALNEYRKAAVLPLITLKKDLKENFAEEHCKAVYSFLQKNKIPQNLKVLAENLALAGRVEEALECEKIWNIIMDALDSFALSAAGDIMSAAGFYNLFKLSLSNIQTGSLPQGLDEIVIGSADRTRLAAPKAVFIAGANEGIFPAENISGGIFTDKEKLSLKEAGVDFADTSGSREENERLIVYSALTIPREKLYITYSLNDPTGNAMNPSEIISFILNKFLECSRLDYNSLPDEYFIESGQTAFEQASSRFSENTPLSESLIAYFNDKEEYKSRLEAVERAVSEKPFKIEDKNIAEKLFTSNMSLSPSRIETYHKCPFQYFCKYGLAAKQRKKADIDPAQSGQITHFIFEKLFTEYRDDALSDSGARREAAVQKALDEYVETHMGGLEGKPQRFVFLLSKLKERVVFLLANIAAEFKITSFEIKDAELSISKSGDVPPYELPLADGKKTHVNGLVDRVDTMEKDGRAYLRVIDYKTGAKGFRLSDILSGLNMQMLIYLFILAANAGERYGKTAPAGVLYFPARQADPVLDRDADENAVNEKRLESSKMSGLVLADPDVINGMEKGAAGLFIPASIDGDGNIQGRVIT